MIMKHPDKWRDTIDPFALPYANILWAGHHISGILDFELAGYGNKEFDIAWAVFRRPGQKFLRTEAALLYRPDGMQGVFRVYLKTPNVTGSEKFLR